MLAEASRQVGASDHTKRRPAYSQSMTVEGKPVIVDPALEAEGFQGHVLKSEHIDESAANTTGEISLLFLLSYPEALMLITGLLPLGTPQPANSPAFSSLPNNAQGDNPPVSPSLRDVALSPDSASNARQSQLSMIAASASEMVPQGLSTENDPMADGLPRIGGVWNQSLSSHEQLLFESLQEHDPSLTAATQTQRAASFPRPIAMNPNTQAKGFVNEFGNSTKPTKPKVRGRFSAARRREVQEVRKRGACIRCRMLKKPVGSCLLQER